MRQSQEMLNTDPNAHRILLLAAYRANWHTGVGMVGCTDFSGMSHKEYRGAIKRIKKGNQRAIKTTNKGTLVNVVECGFAEFGEEVKKQSRSQKGQSNSEKRATNEDNYKIKIKDKTPLPPLGIEPDLWQEFLATRKRLKATPCKLPRSPVSARKHPSGTKRAWICSSI